MEVTILGIVVCSVIYLIRSYESIWRNEHILNLRFFLDLDNRFAKNSRNLGQGCCGESVRSGQPSGNLGLALTQQGGEFALGHFLCLKKVIDSVGDVHIETHFLSSLRSYVCKTLFKYGVLLQRCKSGTVKCLQRASGRGRCVRQFQGAKRTLFSTNSESKDTIYLNH